jgi:hypothetical protein
MIFIKNIPLSPSPWRVNDENRGIVTDLNDKRVAVVPKPKPGVVEHEKRLANLAAISCAPELLAALREAAWRLEEAGITPSTDLYDLINRASYGVPDVVPKKD